MDDKYCPACGSRAFKRIVYGLPGPDAMESGGSDDFVFGGCCVTPDSPEFQCAECHTGFKSLDRPPLTEFKYFQFSLERQSGPSHYIFIDGEGDSKIIKYGYSKDGRCIDVKESAAGEAEESDTYKIKHVELDRWRWQHFLRQLGVWDLELWDEGYANYRIFDGARWKVEIQYADGKRIIKSSSSTYPIGWRRFLAMMEMNVDERIR